MRPGRVATRLLRVDVAAFATILDDNGWVLLIRRHDLDAWEAPGGGVEDGESPWEAVVRETREETGLAVHVEGLTGLYWRPTKPALVLQFICRVVEGTPTPTEEAAKLSYFPVDAMPERLAPVVGERIRDSLGATVILRTQDGPGAREFISSLIRRSST